MAMALAEAHFVTIRKAATRFGVHENTVRNWMDRHLVRYYQLPSGIRRLPLDEVERLEREMFAVPTSFYEPPVTKAPISAAPEPLEGHLP